MEDDRFNAPTHQLVEVQVPNCGVVLSSDGRSANLIRDTRVVSDKVVYVDNIADSMNKPQFVQMVKEYAKRGPVVDVKFLQRTKGGSYAFVEFEAEEDGREAIAGLNTRKFTTSEGHVLELRASKAENPEEVLSNKNLYVKGIPTNWSNEDLKTRFADFGNVSFSRVLKKPGNNDENTGVGFVHFYETSHAVKAIEGTDAQPVDPENPQLGYLTVKFARAKKGRSNYGRRGRRNRNWDRSGHGGDYGGQGMPNWNFGRRNGGGMRGRGRGSQWGYGPPNEEVWAKMVEIMQSMSMWQQPYGCPPMYGGSGYPNYYNPNMSDPAERGNNLPGTGNY